MQNFKKCFDQSELRMQRLEGKRVDKDEMAQNEPPHLYVPCLQMHLFSFFFLRFKC